MTTLAWDGYTLATDSRCTAGEAIISDTTKKLHRIKDAWIAVAGSANDCEAFLQWFKRGRPARNKPELDGFTALVVINNKCTRYEDKLFPLAVEGLCADGSGRDVALGAMLAGATAAQAIEAACKINIYTGGAVQASK